MSGTPSRFNRRVRKLWKSGKSMTTAAAGLRARSAWSSERSAPRNSGSFSRTSEMPTTESASDRTTVSSPASPSRAPPIPNAGSAGRRSGSALSRRAPWRSPEASPADRRRFTPSLPREGVHQPRHREPAEHERGHQHPEELPALPAILPPQQGEEGGHEKRVEGHDEEVVGRDEADHDLRPR